ncbi:hypothetical protein ACFVSW_25655 [Neobacillus sp. NPDC058068]|uniref:hypothetical protein n=1 Tax=Neobacillus sp. NPDC058068 TaxID=3346325 RepID=UPI0036DD0BBE
MKRQKTVYEAAIDHGYSRGSFLKMWTAFAVNEKDKVIDQLREFPVGKDVVAT